MCRLLVENSDLLVELRDLLIAKTLRLGECQLDEEAKADFDENFRCIVAGMVEDKLEYAFEV